MAGAISLPDRLTKLLDFPASMTGHGLKIPRVNLSETALEFIPDKFSAWKNVLEYNVSGSTATTVLVGPLTIGNNSFTVADATSFAVGQGVAIQGASSSIAYGPSGYEHLSIITDITGNSITIANVATATAADGNTVYHDETDAINALISAGAQIYFPSQYSYNVAKKIIVNSEFCWLIGSLLPITNWLVIGDVETHPTYGHEIAGTVTVSSNVPVIVSRNKTDDCVYITADDCGMVGFVIKEADTTGYRTAGSHISVGDGTNTINRTALSHINMAYPYIGLRLRKTMSSRINYISAAQFGQTGILLSGVAPNGAMQNSNLSFVSQYDNPYGVPDACITINAADANQWGVISTWCHELTYAAIWLYPVDGSISDQQFTNLYTDHLNPYGIKMESVGSYRCENIIVVQHGGNSRHSAFAGYLYVGDGCKRITYVAGRWKAGSGTGASARGAYIAGQFVSITGAIMDQVGNTTAIGIEVAGTANNVTVIGNVIDTTAVGVRALSGATNIIITGNTLPGGIDIATNVNREHIKNNTGVQDYLTSIATPPNFIGQESLVSGIWYRAIGTSSTADWKALN